MIWWILPILIISLLLVLPVSLCIYFNGEFTLLVKVLFFKYTFDFKKSKKPKQKPKEQVQQQSDSFLQKLSQFKTVISVVRSLIRAFKVKIFKADITVSTYDPCDTALLYGATSTAVYSVAQIFDARNNDIKINADYNEGVGKVYFDIIASTNLYKLLTGLILWAINGKIKLNNN